MLNMHDFKERIEQPCVQITKYILKQSTYCIKHQKKQNVVVAHMKKHIMNTYE